MVNTNISPMSSTCYVQPAVITAHDKVGRPCLDVVLLGSRKNGLDSILS